MKLNFALVLAAAALPLTLVTAQQAQAQTPAAAIEPWPEAWFEIFKLAPGKQEEFVRRLAQADEVGAAGGLPPTQLFFHENGADFDVILFKPVTGIDPTPEPRRSAPRATALPRSAPMQCVRAPEKPRA